MVNGDGEKPKYWSEANSDLELPWEGGGQSVTEKKKKKKSAFAFAEEETQSSLSALPPPAAEGMFAEWPAEQDTGLSRKSRLRGVRWRT